MKETFPLKIVIAPDKFKGSLSAFEFCKATREGILSVRSDVEIIDAPLADGGDGTIDVVQHYLNGEKIDLEVKDPLFRNIRAAYLFDNLTKTAWIEMAKASGLELLTENERNPMHTTSFGTGQMIADALDRGAQNILIGLGGSATNDLGTGMAAALGYRFLDSEGKEFIPTGKNLDRVTNIDNSNMHPGLRKSKVIATTDVKNPLYGKNGAAYVYAGQKGASEKEITRLDKGLRQLSKCIYEQFAINLQTFEGAGAAGGAGGGALVFLNAELKSGVEVLKKIAGFEVKIKNADWIITGEGKLDSQTFSGKVISGVIKSARQQHIPVAAFCGKILLSDKVLQQNGIAYVSEISKNETSLEGAFLNAYQNLRNAVKDFAITL